MDYRDEMKELTSPLRESVKVFGKKIVTFFRDYGKYVIHINDSTGYSKLFAYFMQMLCT